MSLGDVVDQFHDQHRLAHTSTTEQPDLASLGVRGQQVHDLDASDQHVRRHTLIDKQGRIAVDGQVVLGLDGSSLINGLTNHVHDAAKRCLTDRDGDWGTCVGDGQLAAQALRDAERDATDNTVTQVLRHLEHDTVVGVEQLQGVVDCWQITFGKVDVHNGTNNLADGSLGLELGDVLKGRINVGDFSIQELGSAQGGIVLLSTLQSISGFLHHLGREW
mmetsp:Transcript_11256/g.12726  ORF Transcript_11256/g.12726 Transcript_11256/m.12726 type:complete len:219 (-) Transcript_11256:237-893(-)